MLVIVFIVAILKQNIFLILFLLAIEIMAALWYTISYIPFGRKMCMAFLRSTGACMPCFYVYDQAKLQYDAYQAANNTGSTTNSIAQTMGVAEKKDTSFSGRMSGMMRGGEKV